LQLVHRPRLPSIFRTDNGWEDTFGVELKHADHLNFSTIAVPAQAYKDVPGRLPKSAR
jgi:hypothetical protein